MQASDVGLADPAATWDAIASDPKAMLIDVRTQAEWAYVGIVDLSSIGREPAFIEWQTDTPADSTVAYGTTENLCESVYEEQEVITEGSQ